MVTYYGGRIVDDSGNAVTDSNNEFGLCKVTFNPGLGSGEEIIMYVYPNTSIHLPYCTGGIVSFTAPSTKTIFAGWATSEPSSYMTSTSGGIINPCTHAHSTTCTITTSITFYAVWYTPHTYTAMNGTTDCGHALKVSSTVEGMADSYTFDSSKQIRSAGSISYSDFTNVYGETYRFSGWTGEGGKTYTLYNAKGENKGSGSISAVYGSTTNHGVHFKYLLNFTIPSISLTPGTYIMIASNIICTYVVYATSILNLRNLKLYDSNNNVLEDYSAPYHTAVLLPSPSAYHKEGSTLAAWSTTYNDAPLYRPTGTFVNVGFAKDNDEGDIDIWTAEYKANTYVVTYDLNGGVINTMVTGNTELSYVSQTGKTLYINPSSSYARDGYELIGWERVMGAEKLDGNNLIPSSYPYYFYTGHESSVKEEDGMTPKFTFVTLKAVWVEKGLSPARRTLTAKSSKLSGASKDSDVDMYPVYDTYTYFLPRTDSTDFKPADQYTFAMWDGIYSDIFPQQAESNSFSSVVTISSDEVFEARYSQTSYSFTLVLMNCTNGTGANDTIIYNATSEGKTSYTFTGIRDEDNDIIPVINGYEFIGWGIGEGASSVVYSSDTNSITISLGASDVKQEGNVLTLTLFAIWMDNAPSFRLIFQYPFCDDLLTTQLSTLDSASNISEDTYTFEIPNIVPKRSSPWIFLGWKKDLNPYDTSEEGQELYNPRDSIEITKEDGYGRQVLYAHWYRYKYDLSYDLNGGFGKVQNLLEYSVLNGDRSVQISNVTPTHSTQRFMHWSDGASNYQPGTILTLSPSKYALNLNTGGEAFYASLDKWELYNSSGLDNPKKVVLTAIYVGADASLFFNLQGGTWDQKENPLRGQKDPNSTSESHIFIIPENPTQSTYKFYRWGTSPTDRSSATLSEGDEFAVRYGQDATLYAHWSYSPEGSLPDNAVYDPITGEVLRVSGILKHLGSAEEGVEKEFSLEPPEGTDDDYFVSKYPQYKAMLYLRKDDVMTRVSTSAWCYTKVNYANIIQDDGKVISQRTLSLVVTRSSVPNTVSDGGYGDQYVMRVITIDSAGKEYNAYYSFIVEPAGELVDKILAPAECILSKYMQEGGTDSERYVRYQMSIEGITHFSRNYDVSITEFPVLTRKVRDRYIIDMGTVETYSLSFTRSNPRIVDDASEDSKNWSNAQWILRFRNFLDFWQNLSYDLTDSSKYERTGGFRFTYMPSDISLYPIIDKNVFVKGAVDFDYMVGKAKGNLTLVVANMQMKEARLPETSKIYLCRSKENAERKVYTYSLAVFQGVPVMVPTFPADYGKNCVYWRDVTGEQYFPGEMKSISFADIYLYPVEAELLSEVEYLESCTDKTIEIPEGATVMKAIIVGGGGCGALGSYKLHYGVFDWTDDDFVDVTSGGGGGAGQTKYTSNLVNGGEIVTINVGAGGSYYAVSMEEGHIISEPGEDSSVEVSGITLVAKGGAAASMSTAGAGVYAGGNGYFKGGYTNFGDFDTSENPGTTSASSPRGIPGKGSKFGSGGGASNLEAEVNGSGVTSMGGYWSGTSKIAPQYGGGGAGGGFGAQFELGSIGSSVVGTPQEGASGYVKLMFYQPKDQSD